MNTEIVLTYTKDMWVHKDLLSEKTIKSKKYILVKLSLYRELGHSFIDETWKHITAYYNETHVCKHEKLLSESCFSCKRS